MLWPSPPFLSAYPVWHATPRNVARRITCSVLPRVNWTPALGVSLERFVAASKWTIQPLVAASSISLVLLVGAPVLAFKSADLEDNLNNIPSQLSSAGEKRPGNLGKLLKNKEVQDCARKCVATCVRGGEGAPGLGPISVRKDLIVFKDGFRSRQYCLSECTQVCAASLGVK